MKEYREDIKTIVQVLIFGSCFMATFLDLPGVVMLILFLFLLLARIYEKLLYFSQRNEQELRVITHTDIYHQMTSFIFGGFIMLFAIGLFVTNTISYTYLFIGGLIGSFIFTNALFYIPSLLLKIEQEKLHITGPNENIARAKQIVELKDIKSIDIEEETISILKKDDSTCELLRLDLNKKGQVKTAGFLAEIMKDHKLQGQIAISDMN